MQSGLVQLKWNKYGEYSYNIVAEDANGLSEGDIPDFLLEEEEEND